MADVDVSKAGRTLDQPCSLLPSHVLRAWHQPMKLLSDFFSFYGHLCHPTDSWISNKKIWPTMRFLTVTFMPYFITDSSNLARKCVAFLLTFLMTSFLFVPPSRLIHLPYHLGCVLHTPHLSPERCQMSGHHTSWQLSGSRGTLHSIAEQGKTWKPDSSVGAVMGQDINRVARWHCWGVAGQGLMPLGWSWG